MARRRAGTAKPRGTALRGGGRRGKAKAGAKAGAKAAVPEVTLASEATLAERFAALERERDALLTALEQERTRRLALEEVHAATRDRIAWALDSLQAILDSRT
jgi:hypothetical protein